MFFPEALCQHDQHNSQDTAACKIQGQCHVADTSCFARIVPQTADWVLLIARCGAHPLHETHLLSLNVSHPSLLLHTAKDRLLVAEQHVLRLVRFQLYIDLPHKYLLNLCKLLAVSRATTAAALCLTNDSIAYTDLCLRRQPMEVAAAALQLCMGLLGDQSPGVDKRDSSTGHVDDGTQPVTGHSGRDNGSTDMQCDGGIAANDHDRMMYSRHGQALEPGAGVSGSAGGPSHNGCDGDMDWVSAVGLSRAAVDVVADELLGLLDAGVLRAGDAKLAGEMPAMNTGR